MDSLEKEYLIELAKELWHGMEDDFCVQVDNFPDVMVFGGTNRVVWSLLHGFKVDRLYCTEKFLNNIEGRF